MIKRSIPLALSLIGIIAVILLVKRIMAPIPDQPMIVEPASNPYLRSVAASGLIEAAQENILIGSPMDGLVEEVFVKVWDPICQGDPLFKLDTRELEALVEVNQAKLDVAKAKLERLKDQYDRLLQVSDPRAISIDLLKTRQYDVKVAEVEAHAAEKELKLHKTLLERMTVRSPCSGVIIQKNIKPGEYLSLSPKEPALVLGDIRAFQVRAQVDEQNASRIVSGANATAYPKNAPDCPIPLEFVRIEPYVIPKKSLTGSSDERVDTRVLQVIYRFEPGQKQSLYIGQQLDVFINARTD